MEGRGRGLIAVFGLFEVIHRKKLSAALFEVTDSIISAALVVTAFNISFSVPSKTLHHFIVVFYS